MAAQKVGARCTSVARCAALMLVIYLAVDTMQVSARESTFGTLQHYCTTNPPAPLRPPCT
jgi:hypothetical protein